jgi:two-component system, response regulator PdtaR
MGYRRSEVQILSPRPIGFDSHEKADVMQSNTQQRAPHRILIADDESLIRLDLREMLTHLGYEVVAEAADGRQAVDLARKLKPDLVVMDIRMPEVDGIQAAGILTSERIAPVVLLTAFSDNQLVEQAREAGVVGYVVKPFREAELMPVIELSFARFEEFRALEKEIGNLNEALESRKVVERAKGVLMESYQLRESEAFHRIRKASMDSRKSMKEVAEAILLTHQMEMAGKGAESESEGKSA